MKNILLVGEALVLFYADEYGTLSEATEFKKGLAGAEVNVGIGLSRLGHTVQYVTKISRDAFGPYIENALKKDNLLLDYATYNDKPTGIMMKNKVKDDDPETIYFRKGSAPSTLSIADINTIDFSTLDLVHVTGIPPALSETAKDACIHLVKKAKEAGVFITFDPNLRPSLWDSEERMIQVLNEIASYASVVLPGESEGELLTGAKDLVGISQFYLNMGVETVVIKCGSKGAYVQTKTEEGFFVPGYKVEKVVDTVGAGDGFAVGTISGYLDGLSWYDAVRRANAIGSIQVQFPGDNEGLPTKSALDAYMQGEK